MVIDVHLLVEFYSTLDSLVVHENRAGGIFSQDDFVNAIHSTVLSAGHTTTPYFIFIEKAIRRPNS